MFWSIITVVSLSVVQHASSFSTGAPISACGDITPGHGYDPQDGPSPYQLSVSSNTYSPGQANEVTLWGNGTTFKGFLLQATNAESDDLTRIGTFNITDSTYKYACTVDDMNAITHTGSTPKNNISSMWIAPNENRGPLHFRVTVVEEYTTYWVDLKSTVMQPFDFPQSSEQTSVSSGTSSTPQTTTPAPSELPPVTIDLSTCGLTKSCYRDPPDCALDDCEVVTTWSRDGDFVAFEVSGLLTSSQNYVGMGLSPTQSMFNTSVVGCIVDQGTLTVHMSYNLPEAKSNTPLNDPNLGLDTDEKFVSIVDGRMNCKFRRAISLVGKQSKSDFDMVFNLDSDYYLLLARGPSSGLQLSYHGATRLVTADTVAVTSRTWVNIGGQNSYPLVKAHACLMILAWMVFASVGVLMPRHFKPAFAQRAWFGKQIWFQIHRPLMVLVFLFTIAGFIIIFVEVGGYASHLTKLPWKAHPILGIIVTFLVITNPIMALFRCAPNDAHRVYFNWAHFLVGQGAHILAAATIWLGVNLPKAQAASWCQWVVLVYICWHILIEIVLSWHARCAFKSIVSKGRSFSLKGMPQTPSSSNLVDMNSPESPNQQETRKVGSRFKATLIVVHAMGVLACAIAVIIGVCQN